MSTAPEHEPLAGTRRIVADWWQRESAVVVIALLVALFLLVTPAFPTPLYVIETGGSVETAETPSHSAMIALWAVAGMSVVASVLLAKCSVRLATTLTLLPFLVVPWLGTFVWGWLLGLVAIAIVVAQQSWRRAVVPYAVALTIAALYCVTDIPAILPIGFVTAGSTPGSRAGAFVLYALSITAAVAVAASVSASRRARQRQLAAAAQEAHAVHVELVVSERAQLARDLHDVVAHHVSLIAVRAESAPYQHPGFDDDARGVLAEIAEDARQALGELRQVLVVLQRAEVGSDGKVSRAPQPEAANIDELILSARAAGQQVEVHGRWGVVPPAQGYVLYRAVQEGLTNARRHAPRAVVVLVRTRAGASIGFTMTNPVRRADGGEPGRGITGMRERVESLGGSVSATAIDGRFELAVALPVDVRDSEVVA